MVQSNMISIASICFDIAIRIWMKEKDSYIVDNVLDLKRIGEKLGCDSFEFRDMSQNINDFITQVAKKLYNSKMLVALPDERKIEIMNQLIADIRDSDIVEEKLTEGVLNDIDLKELVESKSKDKRKLWSDKENGAYANCLRYAANAIENFVYESPIFSNDAIKLLYQRDGEMFDAVLQKLDNILKILNSQKSTIDEYREFETDYLLKVSKEYKKIEIFGSGLRRDTKRYDISTSYIELSCSDNKDEEVSQDLSQVIKNNNIVWISGEAGGGKTTFIQWLATNGISGEGAIEELRGLVPIIVKLRNATFPLNLQGEIEKSLGVVCPVKWIDYLIEYDKILLLVDGLDEISKYDRQKVYTFIEDYVENANIKKNQNCRSRIVITSRPYIDDELMIAHGSYRILRMNMRNIDKFVLYWYKTIVENQEDVTSYVERLKANIKKTPSIKAIAGTPLLCAMICALNYTSNETIPTNRNELYEKCCQMLIEDRERERGIEVADVDDLQKLDYTKKTIIISKIARYMLENEASEVDKENVLEYVKGFISYSTIIDSFTIKDSPVLLIDYLVQRTGIIREPSKGKIDFVHKTFLEYLAAKAIMRNEEWEKIEKNLLNPFWKETIIMCFNHMNQEKASELLEDLVNYYRDTGTEEYLFMASLCANNANDIKVEINELIKNEISHLIPPHKQSIGKLATAGNYIIPFLENKKEYSEEQRKYCLVLLERLLRGAESAEAISVLVSYLKVECNYNILIRDARILTWYPKEILDEYEVRKLIYNTLCDIVQKENECVVTNDVLSLCETIDSVESSPLNCVENLTLYETDSSHEWHGLRDRVYRYFNNVSNVAIMNITSVEMLDILNYISNIQKLSVHVSNDEDIIINYLDKLLNKDLIKSFEYVSKDLTYICDKDIELFSQMEDLTLVIPNYRLDFQITDWSNAKKIKNVKIIVHEAVYWEEQDLFELWKKRYPNIKFDIGFSSRNNSF